MWFRELKPSGIDAPIWYKLTWMEVMPAGEVGLIEELEVTDRIL